MVSGGSVNAFLYLNFAQYTQGLNNAMKEMQNFANGVQSVAKDTVKSWEQVQKASEGVGKSAGDLPQTNKKVAESMQQLNRFNADATKINQEYNRQINQGMSFGGQYNQMLGNQAKLWEQYAQKNARATNTITSNSAKIAGEFTRISDIFGSSRAFKEGAFTPYNLGMKNTQAQTNSLSSSITSMGSRAVSTFGSMASGLSNFTNSFMNFGTFFGVMGVAALGKFTIGAGMARQETQSMFKFMGMADEQIKKLTDDATTFAVSASKISVDELNQGLSKIYASHKMNVDILDQSIPAIGDFMARYKSEGRTAQEAILAINDAMDGQFRRMQELGIKKSDLTEKGWDVSKPETFFNALNAVFKDRGWEGWANKMLSTQDKLDVLSEKIQKAGADIGYAMLPVLDAIITGITSIVNVLGGPLTGALIVIAGGILVFSFFYESLVLIGDGALYLLGRLALLGTGFNVASIEGLGLAGTLDLMAINALASATGLSMATVSQLGLAGALDYGVLSLVAWITGESMATVSTMSFTGAIWAMTQALLANPIVRVIAVLLALGAVIYEVGNYLGWWNSLGSMASVIWARFVNICQQVWVALSPIGNAFTSLGQAIQGFLSGAWNSIVVTFQEFGNQLGSVFAPLTNIYNVFAQFTQLNGGGISGFIKTLFNPDIWRSSALDVLQVMKEFGKLIVMDILFGVSGAGGLSVIFDNLFGTGTTAKIRDSIASLVGDISGIFNEAFSSINTSGGILGFFTSTLSAIPTLLSGIGLSIANWALSIDWVGMFSGFVDGVTNAIDSVINMITNFDIGSLFGQSAGNGGDQAGQKIVEGVQKQVTPSKFQQLFQKVADKMAQIDWGGVLNTFLGLMLKLSMAVGTAGFRIGIALLTKLGQGIWNGLASINWGSLAMGLVTALGNAIASYNPITILVRALFGDNAGNAVENGFKTAFAGIGNIVSMIWGFLFGGGAGNALSAFTSFLTGINWESAIIGWMQTLIQSFAHYNPITLMTVLIFGPSAGAKVQNAIKRILNGILFTFIRGLRVLWNGIKTVVMGLYNFWKGVWTLFSIIVQHVWKSIKSGVTTAWNGITGFLRGVWNGILSTGRSIWNGVYNAVNTPLRNMYNSAVSIGQQIYSTLANVFTQIYNTLKPIWDQLTSGWNGLRDGFVNAANAIRDGVWGPISTLYDRLKEFWGWITHPFGGGGTSGGVSGPSGGGGGGASGGYAGPGSSRSSPRSSANSRNYSGGLFAGIKNMAFNTTRGLTAEDPTGYAGPRHGFQLGDGPKDGCDGEPCYAGDFDFSKSWIDEATKLVKSWNMNINGVQMSITDALDGGNLGLFNSIASKLVGATHYMYYYNHRYTPQQIMTETHGMNCYDGALMMMALGQKMGLSTSMGHGNWGKDGHAWAIIGGQVFDTTAYQHGYGWRAPQVNYGGPSPSMSNMQYAGTKTSKKPEVHIHMHGDVYGMKDFDKKVEKAVDKALPGGY